MGLRRNNWVGEEGGEGDGEGWLFRVRVCVG